MFGYSSPIQLGLAAVAIVFSVVLHELAHGYVALWNGDRTAKMYGRLTLNPLKHFNLLGLIMMLLVRFGYANPVPINPDNFRNRKLGLFTVSIAGIALNLLIAFFVSPLYLLCARSNHIVAEYFMYFFSWVLVINVNLALFNLLPFYPLDGFRVIESCTRAMNPFTRFMRNHGQLILILLIGISVIVDVFGMPYWLDLIGMYIGTCRDWILNDLFLEFWSLFF